MRWDLEGWPGDPTKAAFLFTTASHGHTKVATMHVRQFETGVEELLHLGWLLAPISDYAKAVYEYNPD